MKKNIIIGGLALISVLSMAFGFHQKIRADKNEVLVIENERRAIQLMDKLVWLPMKLNVSVRLQKQILLRL